MIKILENLKKIGDELEKSGQVKSAQVVTNTMQSLSKLKTAQYEGVQGYWIRNRRCWDNCYRQKRTASPSRPAQEVWFDCWDEYLKSINDNNSGWEKYAGNEKIVKTANLDDAKHFHDEVQKRIKAGAPIPNAVYEVIEQARLADKSLDNANNLLKVAEHLEKIGKKELSQKVYDACFDIIKEGAGFWGGIGGGIGRGAKWLGQTWMGSREGTGWGSSYRTAEAILKEIIDDINYLLAMPKSSQIAAINHLLKLAWTKEGIAESLNKRRGSVVQADAGKGINPSVFNTPRTPTPATPATDITPFSTWERKRKGVPQSDTGTQTAVPAEETAQKAPAEKRRDLLQNLIPEQNRAQLFLGIRNKANEQRPELARYLGQARQRGHQQTAQMIQFSLKALEQFDTKINQAIQQGQNDRSSEMQSKIGNDAYAVLTELRNNLINAVAGIQQSGDAESAGLEQKAQGTPQAEESAWGHGWDEQKDFPVVGQMIAEIVQRVNMREMSQGDGWKELIGKIRSEYAQATEAVQQQPGA